MLGLQNRAAKRFAARNAERIRSQVLGIPARPVRGAKCSAQQLVRVRHCAHGGHCVTHTPQPAQQWYQQQANVKQSAGEWPTAWTRKYLWPTRYVRMIPARCLLIPTPCLPVPAEQGSSH